LFDETTNSSHSAGAVSNGKTSAQARRANHSKSNSYTDQASELRDPYPGDEVNALIEAAKANRWGHRDATMILLAFRHGLRVAELCDLRWDQVEFNAAVLHVRRVKNGTPSTHPLLGDEMRALRRLQRESAPSPFVFVSERGSPFTTAGFARMIERAAASAGLELKAHPHMLRHACGYALANKGHEAPPASCQRTRAAETRLVTLVAEAAVSRR
jgi:integrase